MISKIWNCWIRNNHIWGTVALEFLGFGVMRTHYECQICGKKKTKDEYIYS